MSTYGEPLSMGIASVFSPAGVFAHVYTNPLFPGLAQTMLAMSV